MSNKADQSNSVNIYGGTTRDIRVGNDYHTVTKLSVREELSEVRQAVKAAPADVQAEATEKLDQLQDETAKGAAAHDGTIAKLIDGLIGLVPSATSAIVSAFGTPILGALSLPITAAVLQKLRSE